MSADWQEDPRYLPSLHTPISRVEEGLYMGSAEARACLHDDNDSALGITHIVSVVTPFQRLRLAPVRANVHETAFDLADALTVDPAAVHALLDASTAVIAAARAARGTVLVHCEAGVSRSATVVLDYLMQRDALSFADALALLGEARYCACPNPLFQRVLRARERR